MKTISFTLLSFIALILFSGNIRAQHQIENHGRRLNPYAGLTYNFHTMKYLDSETEGGNYSHSHFPGIEFGFILNPKEEKGWLLEYRNSFLGELAIYGIAKQTSNPYQGFLNDIVDRTIGNGFLGRMDVGKTIISTAERDLRAGFSISDKVILGTDDYPLTTYLHDDEDTYTNSGFHFTPGVFATYLLQLQNQAVLFINFSISQSILNLHQFGKDNAIDHFVLPLFTEMQITYQMKGGTYLRTGAMYVASINGVPADARLNVGVGYTFRYK
jgi:hypothetical protein